MLITRLGYGLNMREWWAQTERTWISIFRINDGVTISFLKLSWGFLYCMTLTVQLLSLLLYIGNLCACLPNVPPNVVLLMFGQTPVELYLLGSQIGLEWTDSCFNGSFAISESHLQEILPFRRPFGCTSKSTLSCDFTPRPFVSARVRSWRSTQLCLERSCKMAGFPRWLLQALVTLRNCGLKHRSCLGRSTYGGGLDCTLIISYLSRGRLLLEPEAVIVFHLWGSSFRFRRSVDVLAVSNVHANLRYSDQKHTSTCYIILLSSTIEAISCVPMRKLPLTRSQAGGHAGPGHTIFSKFPLLDPTNCRLLPFLLFY